MKVAISAEGRDLESRIDPRFGRCAYFLIVETGDMTFEAFQNDAMTLGGGAGISAAQFVVSRGAKAVITGNCGPNAAQALGAAGVELFLGQSGGVRDCLERFMNRDIQAAQGPNVEDHFGMGGAQLQGRGQGPGDGGGMGRGKGCGRGGGMGRGMGGGMGCGRGGGGGQGPMGSGRQSGGWKPGGSKT